ncbi:MAG: redox-sensing transcriptional repressor Rex [Sedimentisphaerales bacterium]|nr:redox-sensing transcriptional repressor Rex [Sedimentisphaerales bacterium]
MNHISHKSIERFCAYRRLLRTVRKTGVTNVYSHDLAEMSGGTAAQVRRDLMVIGCGGNPKTGYEVDDLLQCFGDFLDNPDVESIALAGVGNLGRALLDFFSSHHPKLKIVASFDVDPHKVGRVINGCRCYDIADVKSIITDKKINVAILAVPADVAQSVAEKFADASVAGFLNFAPEPLRLPSRVIVENMDMTTALEKTVFLARQNSQT